MKQVWIRLTRLEVETYASSITVPKELVQRYLFAVQNVADEFAEEQTSYQKQAYSIAIECFDEIKTIVSKEYPNLDEWALSDIALEIAKRIRVKNG